jgi:hypothetical protein
MEPWLNEDVTNGISETRSCGASAHFGDTRAHNKFKSSSLLEISSPVVAWPPAEVLEKMEIESASKVVESEDNSGGRCAPLVPGNDDACTQSKDQVTCEEASATLHCTWFASADHAPKLVFPESLSDIHEYALEEEEHFKSERQKMLEEECLNVTYQPSVEDGGYDPLVLADQGFTTKPNGRKYVSACNYANTMGVGGNAPSKGCAPHCWMGFRMLELAKMRDSLPIPPSSRPQPQVPNPTTANEGVSAPVTETVQEDDAVVDDTSNSWVADPSCISINDPYNQKAYYGYIVDIDQFSNAQDISLGIRELGNLLSMINLHPTIPIEARNTLKKCMPRLKHAMQSWMLPHCDGSCQLKKPCKNWCEKLRHDCLTSTAVTDSLSQIVEGDSEVRKMAISMIGNQMNVVDVLIRKLLTCGGESGITFSKNEDSCRSEDAIQAEPCVPTNGAQPPIPVETQAAEEAEEVTEVATTATSSPPMPIMTVDPKCKTIIDPLDETRHYTGTLSESFTQDEYTNGMHSLRGLLDFVGDLVGKQCVKAIVHTTSAWLAPSCSETCMPRKACSTWCESLASECLPAHVIGMLSQILPGGPLRSVVESQVTDKKSLELVDTVLALVKHGDCFADIFSSNKDCQIAVTSASCSPPPPHSLLPLPSTSPQNSTRPKSQEISLQSDSMAPPLQQQPLTGTQQIMGTVVEAAVDQAKGEIGGLIPQIEGEIVKQEEDLSGKLTKAETALTGNSDKTMQSSATAAPIQPLTGTQKIMGTVVEGAVDQAKGEIGGLIPQIEGEIVKQEEDLSGKLKRAQNALINSTEPESRTSDTRQYLPPTWQKDVVVDEDAGVAMRMLGDKSIKPLL